MSWLGRGYGFGGGEKVSNTISASKEMMGAVATMTYTKGSSEGIQCEWDPEMPQPVGKKAQDRFVRLYKPFRRDFYQQVANLEQISIAIADLGHGGEVTLDGMVVPEEED